MKKLEAKRQQQGPKYTKLMESKSWEDGNGVRR